MSELLLLVREHPFLIPGFIAPPGHKDNILKASAWDFSRPLPSPRFKLVTVHNMGMSPFKAPTFHLRASGFDMHVLHGIAAQIVRTFL
jgi:hypothetical protein